MKKKKDKIVVTIVLSLGIIFCLYAIYTCLFKGIIFGRTFDVTISSNDPGIKIVYSIAYLIGTIFLSMCLIAIWSDKLKGLVKRSKE